MRNTSSGRLHSRAGAAPIKSYLVEVEGTRTHFLESGSDRDGTPLLIVHGYNGSSDYWRPGVMPRLGLERRVLALDLPGNGHSGILPRHTLLSYCEFLRGFISRLGLAAVDIMGHSMGGQIAIALAAQEYGPLRRLVLVDSAGLPDLVRRKWLVPIGMLRDSSTWLVRYYPLFIQIGVRARAPLESLAILRSESVSHLLQGVRVPTLIVWGEKDCLIPLEHGRHMAMKIQGARLAVMRGTGHTPFFERPEEFARILLGFLRD